MGRLSPFDTEQMGHREAESFSQAGTVYGAEFGSTSVQLQNLYSVASPRPLCLLEAVGPVLGLGGGQGRTPAIGAS